MSVSRIFGLTIFITIQYWHLIFLCKQYKLFILSTWYFPSFRLWASQTNSTLWVCCCCCCLCVCVCMRACVCLTNKFIWLLITPNTNSFTKMQLITKLPDTLISKSALAVLFYMKLVEIKLAHVQASIHFCSKISHVCSFLPPKHKHHQL